MARLIRPPSDPLRRASAILPDNARILGLAREPVLRPGQRPPATARVLVQEASGRVLQLSIARSTASGPAAAQALDDSLQRIGSALAPGGAPGSGVRPGPDGLIDAGID